MTKTAIAMALIFAGSAWAGEGDKDKSPKPDPAMGAYKAMLGNWKCASKSKSASGETERTSVCNDKMDLEGFWLVEVCKSNKHQNTAYYGYDAAAKQYMIIAVGSGGDHYVGTSAGPDAAGKWEWSSKGTDAGKAVESKDVWEFAKDGKSMHDTGTDNAGGSFEATCSKK